MATLQTHWCLTETWSWTCIICRQAPKSLTFEVSREGRGHVEEGRDSLTGGGALPEHSAPPSWAVLCKPSAPPAQLLHAHCGQGPSEGGGRRTKHASAPLWAPSLLIPGPSLSVAKSGRMASGRCTDVATTGHSHGDRSQGGQHRRARLHGARRLFSPCAAPR